MKLRTQLYSKKQGEKEQTAVFLQRQYLLAQQLQPDDPEEETVAVLLELLRPSIRRSIRAASPRTFDDLFEHASDAEADENDDPPKKEARKVETKLKPTTTTEYRQAGPPCEYCPGYHYHRDCPLLNTTSRGASFRALWIPAPDPER